jgi:hypothetical protein
MRGAGYGTASVDHDRKGGPMMTELRRRMLQDMAIRNYALGTRDNSIRAVAKFARHFKKSPDRLGPEEVRAYQVYLVQKKKVSWSWLKIVVSALRFFYAKTLGRDVSLQYIPYPRKQKKLPPRPPISF